MSNRKYKIEEFEYNNFKYIKNYDPEIINGVIEHIQKKPENLFKYYALNEFSVDALRNGYFYASHPFELNDLLDSSIFLYYSSRKLSIEQYQHFFGDVYSKEELKEFYKHDIEERCTGYIQSVYEVATNLFGIISTTEKEFNTLMWPHYTQEKGFQIKFNTTELEESIEKKIHENNEQYLGFYPINYTKKLSPIDISEYDSMMLPLYYSTNIKSSKWEYEKEWRFLISKNNMGVPYTRGGLQPREDYKTDVKNRYVYYDKDLIQEITLGNDFFNKRDFHLEYSDGETFKVKPKDCELCWNYKNLNEFVNYVLEKFPDRIFYSGVKYELDENDILCLVRTKERIQLIDEQEGFHIFKKTGETIQDKI